MSTIRTYVYVAILQNAEGQWEKFGWVGNATDKVSDEAQHLNDHDFITRLVRGGEWDSMLTEEGFKDYLGIKTLMPLASAAELPGTPLTARKPMK